MGYLRKATALLSILSLPLAMCLLTLSVSRPAYSRESLTTQIPPTTLQPSATYFTYLPSMTKPSPPPLSQLPRTVNAPFLDVSQVETLYGETAIFWFGKVTAQQNYADVRVGYNRVELYINVNVFDRLLWYDSDPSPDQLTLWDSLSLYLDRAGNTGGVPSASSYRFDVQLKDWETNHSRWQTAYRGNGSGWVSTPVNFSAASGYRWESASVGGLNNNKNNRGWGATFHIPFASLGLSGPPAQGTHWGLGIALHDRDDAAGTPIPAQVWPETLQTTRPASWGQLRFGLPGYNAPPVTSRQTTVIRHKLNGATVVDAAVGGTIGNMCPSDPAYIWGGWGNANFAGAVQVNIQNQSDLSDWPCFAKYYVTFPLGAIPQGKVIVSATLTLYQFGSAGGAGEAYDSLIQVLTVREDWNESSLTWNNAPLALENVSQAWANPLPQHPGVPGLPRTWDVSRAVAQAYAGGQPLRLALYEADGAMHSGKYFLSSEVDDYIPTYRPTLQVTWGNP